LSDPSLFFSNWHYTVSATRQVVELIATEPSGDTDGFKESLGAFNGGIGRRFGHATAMALASTQRRDLARLDAFAEPPPSRRTVKGGLQLAYDARNYKLYFSEGLYLRATATRDVHRTDDARSALQLEAQASYQLGVLSDHALQLLVTAGSLEGGDRADALRIGGGRSLRGIEARTAWVERYYAGAIDYQIPLAAFDSGTLTTAPFVDAGRIDHRGGQQSSCYFIAPGAGVYFFLKQVAFPGVGLEIGHNAAYMGSFVTVSAGLAL
jgi:hypothetical protein